jgi:enoyl-CoA hydratase
MIGIERVGDVTTIELQRPERRNALNSELVDSLREAMQQAAEDDVHAIVLTGAGTVFCAGADLSGDVFAADFPDKAIALNLAIDAVPVPVIAAINGPAIGAGVQLALVCDLRVVAPTSSSRSPDMVWPLTTGASAGWLRWPGTAARGGCCWPPRSSTRPPR